MPLPVLDQVSPPVKMILVLVLEPPSEGLSSIVVWPKNLPLPGRLPDTSHVPASFGVWTEADQLDHSGVMSGVLFFTQASAMSTGSFGGSAAGLTVSRT